MNEQGGKHGVRFGHVFFNALLGAYFLLWAYLHAGKFIDSQALWKVIEGFLIFQALLLALFFVIRKPAKQTSWNPYDVVIALLGTVSPFLFMPINLQGEASIVAFLFQLFGTVLVSGSYLSLNRSLGILPSNREVRTGWLYGIVRHPMYMSYQFFNIGYVFNHHSIYNISVALLCLLSQILRIYTEEKLLAQDSVYRAYQKKVKWRLIPYIY